MLVTCIEVVTQGFCITTQNLMTFFSMKFCPEISDFGLAKIYLIQESIVSMLGARGTTGYIAPEVFCRNFGSVSHKSAVYSYGICYCLKWLEEEGICVLQLIIYSSDIYLPHWIFKRLELGQELEIHALSNEEDNQIARKMVLVSLWCVQSDPSNHPPVSMMEGNIESLSIPPKPYLSSPSSSPRSEANSSIKLEN
ncbi:hypothetical protein JCGZ_09326 [Jatropha curcas]|uniref:Uncharacterized protein n=1 Tax=Jatropha curcas TaxID=180498 RepID=A0A067KJ34_JATCU|nr:hypothetical protein JCGZ_09326 [Jatropha curcas]